MLSYLKKIIYSNYILTVIKNFIVDFFTYLIEFPDFLKWKNQAEAILKNKKEIIVKMDYAGLGDSLKYSTLPELLKKQYNIDFFLDESCKSLFRHQDVFKLCFQKNPYFCGFKVVKNPYEPRYFLAHSKTNFVDSYEKQLKVKGDGLPRIYYEPKNIPAFNKKIVIDKNQFTGKKLGYHYSDGSIEHVIEQQGLAVYDRYYIDPLKQNLESYVDLIYSAKYFICFMSGGGVVAAALDKQATVLLPDNIFFHSRAVYPWVFKNCKNVSYFHKGQYIK